MSAREDYAALADLAAKATPREWASAHWPGSLAAGPDVGILIGPRLISRDKSQFFSPQDAAYIAAANPAAVTALIERLIEGDDALAFVCEMASSMAEVASELASGDLSGSDGKAQFEHTAYALGDALARARSHLDKT